MAEEECEWRPEAKRDPQRRLYDITRESTAAVVGVHDHPAEAHDVETIVFHLDLSEYEPGGRDQPIHTVTKSHVSILRSEVQRAALRIEWVGLVAFELASLLFCQRAEFNDLHAPMQAGRARRTRRSSNGFGSLGLSIRRCTWP